MPIRTLLSLRPSTRISGWILGAFAGLLLVPTAGTGFPAEAQRPATRSDLRDLLWPVPDIAHRDQAGHEVSAAQLADRIVVVSFITTACTITCVIRTRDLAAAARILPDTLQPRVAFLAISLDPTRDDAAALKAFAASLNLDPARLAILDSDPATAAHQRTALRYPADRSDPPDVVLVFDRIGQLAMTYGANPLDQLRLIRDLAELDRFAQGVGHPPTLGTAPSL